MAHENDSCVAHAVDISSAGVVVVDLDDALTIECSNNGYYGLMGYTKKEYSKKFGESFLSAVLPDYSEDIFSMTHELAPSDGKFRMKIKLAHKWRNYIWAHVSGQIFEPEPGVRKASLVMVDISEDLFLMEQLESEQEYISMVLAVSGDAFFDYDIAHAKMRFSSNFSSRFGIDETMHDYPASLLATGIVADESRGVIEKSEFDPRAGVIENIHLKLPDGDDAWYSLYFNVAENAEGNAIRVVGKIVDVTHNIENIAELIDKASRDPLTKLYNKEETRLRIERTLRDKRVSGLSAFMIIDVDDFKKVNDTFGHQAGDAALVEVSSKLSKIFRDDDIVGRLGGDEFTVLLKGVPSRDLIEKKGGDIVEGMSEIAVDRKGKYAISGSVGISIFPSHGETFEELYRLADEALYESKRKGKNCFTIYNGDKKIKNKKYE